MRFIPTYVGHTLLFRQRSMFSRFIPTYVGHTRDTGSQSPILAVHPHIRGAYLPLPKEKSRKTGSSPHTWGIHTAHRRLCRPGRFIPTYVGHTSLERQRFALCSVHPHIRGAYSTLFHVPAMGCGSSPHTWGIHYMPYLPILLYRFIPTYVGHTGVKTIWQEQLTVHSHIRGAYQHPPPAATWQFGSSPHTWGIPLHPRMGMNSARFIPTYVGHTPSARYQHCRLAVHPHIRGAYRCGRAQRG